MTVLFVTPWYPNRYDAMIGLFVHNHAVAVARHTNIAVNVISVCYSDDCEKREIVESKTDGLKSLILYTQNSTRKSVLHDWKRLLDEYLKRCGRPDVVHANITSLSTLTAVYLKRKFKIPYVLSEHSSSYLPETKTEFSVARKAFLKFVVRNADCFLPVSEYLNRALLSAGFTHQATHVVPNVTNDLFFWGRAQLLHSNAHKELCDMKRTKFIHVSCFSDAAKNISGIVEAAKILKTRDVDFQITLIGTGEDIAAIKRRVDENALADRVFFTGELTPSQVCEKMAESHAVVQFSNYETAGIVLQEAATMQVPIISTPTGIAEEIIDATTGIIVPFNDAAALADAMCRIAKRQIKFSYENLYRKSLPYRANTIAQMLQNIYQSIK